MVDSGLTVGLVAIARPTFDVPLAQSIADGVQQQLQDAGYEVVGTGNELLMDGAGAVKAIESLTESDFDLLILLQASFADSTMAVEIAQAVQTQGSPLLLWAVPDERDGGRLRLNSLCGINLAGHALTLQNISYDYLLTLADDPTALHKIETLAKAGRASRLLSKAHIGLVGEHPAGFDTCIYDANDLATLFGTRVTAFALSDTIQAAADADDEQRDVFKQQVAHHANNLDELDQAALSGTAGVHAALHNLTQEHDMLNQEMCPASCEADVNGTVTSLLLQAISGEQAFVTDLVSIDGESDTGVLWHCGLAPVSMADPEAEIVGTVHSNRKLPLLFEFPLKPGRVTLARLHRTQLGTGKAGYQLVIGGGEMVRAPKSYGGTSGVIRFDRPAIEVFDSVMRQGLEHHFCITYGDHREALETFAQLAGLPTLMVT